MSNDNSREERRKKTLELIDRITPENIHALIDFNDYAKLKQENEDYKLMLKALAGTWECVYEKDFNCWSWFTYDFLPESPYRKIKVNKTSDIPEINDKLREEFKKI